MGYVLGLKIVRYKDCLYIYRERKREIKINTHVYMLDKKYNRAHHTLLTENIDH